MKQPGVESPDSDSDPTIANVSDVLKECLGDPRCYNPFNGVVFWIGMFWGLPAPLVAFWLYGDGFGTGLLNQRPLHYVLLLYPLVTGYLFSLGSHVLAKYISRLQEESIRDYLTGLYNHRYFRRELTRRVDEAQRYEKTFCVVLFDLDHFNRINDEYGHQVGDDVLEEFANLLKNLTRSADLVFRYGGEEFALVLPETGHEDAHALAERIREAVAKHDFEIDRQVTVSGGVAEYPSDSNDGYDLIQVVDERLYEAKGGGRNRVVSEE